MREAYSAAKAALSTPSPLAEQMLAAWELMPKIVKDFRYVINCEAEPDVPQDIQTNLDAADAIIRGGK